MPTDPKARAPEQFAAVDLGSNSFHMMVAATNAQAQLSVVDRIKVNVRLAAGLEADGSISADAEQRALDCLARFGERLSEVPAHHVRAVGTNTLRRASNSVDFLDRARANLGHKIDVISGREEARLIYRGVSRDVETPGRLLVMDIGGGSTELIVGEGPQPVQLDSLYMGCVSWSERYFPGGEVTAKRMDQAVMGARRELQSVVRAYRKAGWQEVVGASGTLNALERILLAQGRDGVRPEGLAWLRERYIAEGNANAVHLEGLSRDRRPVFVGGLAIISALFTGLRLEHMRATPSALREGVVLELVGREHERDIRDETVRRAMDSFGVDGRQAFQVQQTALRLFDAVAPVWGLSRADRDLLRWASALHEVGISLTYTGYHKHGAYLLTHKELPGFSRAEKRRLANLVLAHRGHPDRARLQGHARRIDTPLLHLVALLRIATRIHRRRSPRTPPALTVEASGEALQIGFPEQWLEKRPLTRGDLEDDVDYLGTIGVSVTFA
jgi:exopolyphosphatase/guanosine-5'-triphosphate,3'-diphosphate pyrophosphatase